MLEEADRSLHDALCVIRCLVKKRFLIPGGGAPEAELSVKLTQYAHTLMGMDAYCFRWVESRQVFTAISVTGGGINK